MEKSILRSSALKVFKIKSQGLQGYGIEADLTQISTVKHNAG